MYYVDNPFQPPATISLCPGILGLERGVERVVGRLRTLAYAEIEAFIIENLLVGMEAGILGSAPIWANLKTFPWRFFRGKVDLLLGGYSCQPFRNAGLGLAAAGARWKADRICENQFAGLEDRKGLWYGTERTSPTKLANSRCEGLQGIGNGIGTEKEFTKSFLYGDRWPARPGQGQLDWEAPRLAESGMGCTIDGYNFREDLLRALGNSVVEQTAEFAFRTLMKKHEMTL